MSEVMKLAHASTELANHVAAVVRMSNEMDGLLADAVREDIRPMTKLAVFARIKAMHDAFRVKHFRGTITTINTVVEITTKWAKEEPVSADAPDSQPESPEPAPAAQPVETSEEHNASETAP